MYVGDTGSLLNAYLHVDPDKREAVFDMISSLGGSTGTSFSTEATCLFLCGYITLFEGDTPRVCPEFSIFKKCDLYRHEFEISLLDFITSVKIQKRRGFPALRTTSSEICGEGADEPCDDDDEGLTPTYEDDF